MWRVGATPQFTESMHRRSLLWRNSLRVLIVVLLIVVVNLEEISLADGRKYKIGYDRGPDGKSDPVRTYLTPPNDTVDKFDVTSE